MRAQAVRFHAKAANLEALSPAIESVELPDPAPGMALVQITAAAVNPSDVKAALGAMPYAVFPRTSGRDFAGFAMSGPMEGQAVFGSSGDLGIRRDGTHASHLLVESAALLPKPAGISAEEAAGIGVPFVTATEGYRRAGGPKPGETVLIMGVNGKVGQAAAQIATWRGAQVIGVVRREEGYAGHSSTPVTVINAEAANVAKAVMDATAGRGADVVFNTVGEPYYASGTAALAKAGRQIFIATTGGTVEFNIFAFYRGRHTYCGIDTLALSSVETADVLRELLPGFETGALRPFPVVSNARYTLEKAREAFTSVLGSTRDRVVLVP